MSRLRLALICLMASLPLLAGCPGNNGTPAQTKETAPASGAQTVQGPQATALAQVESGSIAVCGDERPQVCTREYRPVCATRDTGVRCIQAPCPSDEQKTYPNGCSACADETVTQYVAGPCLN